MLFIKWIKTEYYKYRVILFMLLVVVMYEVINYFEEYILENISLRTMEEHRHLTGSRGNYSCRPLKQPRKEYWHVQQSPFYWSKQQKEAVKWIHNVSPVTMFLFGGIYSDKFGGHRVILVGLILCAAIMSSLYLSMLHNNYVFLLMVTLRRGSEGIIWAAVYSLTGKLALPYQRTLFISILFTGRALADFLGYTTVKIIVKWKIVSRIGGGVSFAAAIWWWMTCRSSHFPKVRTITRVPIMDILKSVHLYVLGLLGLASYMYTYIAIKDSKEYMPSVVFIVMGGREEWLIKLALGLVRVFSHMFCGVATVLLVTRYSISVCAVRRGFLWAAIVILLCTLVIIFLAHCNHYLNLCSAILLHYVYPLARSTVGGAILDFSPSCSGTVAGMVFSFTLMARYVITMELYTYFITAELRGHTMQWVEFFFTVAILGFLFTLPFMCCKMRKFSWGRELSRTRTRILETESTGTEASGSVSQGQTSQDTRPSQLKPSPFGWFL